MWKLLVFHIHNENNYAVSMYEWCVFYVSRLNTRFQAEEIKDFLNKELPNEKCYLLVTSKKYFSIFQVPIIYLFYFRRKTMEKIFWKYVLFLFVLL